MPSPRTWAAFKSAVEEVHIEIFEQIKEESKGAVRGVTDLTRTFGEWVGETQVASLREIGEAIASVYNTIKTPLGFLINHIDTFASLSFWGWIIGKGLQVPMALIGIADAFMKLYSALKMVTALNLTGIISLLATPIGAVAALGSLPSGTTYNVEIHQEGFVVQSQSNADRTARAAVSAFRTGIGNGA